MNAVLRVTNIPNRRRRRRRRAALLDQITRLGSVTVKTRTYEEGYAFMAAGIKHGRFTQGLCFTIRAKSCSAEPVYGGSSGRLGLFEKDVDDFFN